MTCAGFDERVALYVGGELDRAAARAVKAHLASCGDCRALEADLRVHYETMVDWRAVVPTQEALDDVRGRVMAAIARGEVRRPLLARLRVPFVTPIVWRTAGVAASAMVLWALWSLLPGPREEGPGARSAAQHGTALPMGSAEPGTRPNLEVRASPVAPALPAAPMMAATAADASGGRVARRARRVAALETAAAPATVDAHEPLAGPRFRRLEFQTADPNVRIIWLLQGHDPAAPPGARQPNGRVSLDTAERRSIS